MGEMRQDRLKSTCRSFGIDLLYSFGSRGGHVRDWLSDDAAPLEPLASDVDIGILPASGRAFTVRDKSLIALALEELFGVPRVDLVVIPEADPFLAANVIRGERLYTRNELDADEFDLYVLRRAGDLAPLERERLALIEDR